MNTEIPITEHPKLPDGVPLLASFHDDRNRLSYYYPLLRRIDGVRVPVTSFHSVSGSYDSYPDIEYRDVTRFMQDIGVSEAFFRSDYSSGKFDDEKGSKVESQDPYDIETVVLEMIRQLGRSKRHLGGRIAVREWIPHDAEVRFFIRDSDVIYWDSIDDVTSAPVKQAERLSESFRHLSWSVDFIRHEATGEWYCIDMGLDGLYHTGDRWVAISEHLDKSQSPERVADQLARPKRYRFHK